jgi:ribosomal protein L24E
MNKCKYCGEYKKVRFYEYIESLLVGGNCFIPKFGLYICEDCDRALLIKDKKREKIIKQKEDKRMIKWKKERDKLLKEEVNKYG